MKDTFASVYLFNYWYNVDAPFASAIEDKEYSLLKEKPHKEEEHNLNEDLLSCVVIMSKGAYYVVILCGHYVIEGATTPPTLTLLYWQEG